MSVSEWELHWKVSSKDWKGVGIITCKNPCLLRLSDDSSIFSSLSSDGCDLDTKLVAEFQLFSVFSSLYS